MEFGVVSELEVSTPVRARALASGPHLLYACARIAAFHPPLLKQALLPRQLRARVSQHWDGSHLSSDAGSL